MIRIGTKVVAINTAKGNIERGKQYLIKRILYRSNKTISGIIVDLDGLSDYNLEPNSYEYYFGDISITPELNKYIKIL